MCEHEVIIGVLQKSLQTWQRRAESTGASERNGVSSQSVESETSKASSLGALFIVKIIEFSAAAEACRAVLSHSSTWRLTSGKSRVK